MFFRAGLITMLLFSLSYSQIDEDITEISPQFSQQYKDPEYSKEKLAEKVETYSKMQNTGRGLLTGGGVALGIGVPSLIGGIALMVNGQYTGIPLYYLGYFGVLVGTPLTIAGGVIKKIGRDKRNEYIDRLNRVSANIGLNSIELTYDF